MINATTPLKTDLWISCGDFKWPAYSGPSLQGHLDAIVYELERRREKGDMDMAACYAWLRERLANLCLTVVESKR